MNESIYDSVHGPVIRSLNQQSVKQAINLRTDNNKWINMHIKINIR